MTRQRAILQHSIVAAAVIILAAVTRFWATPLMARLPADYTNETRYAAVSIFRETPAAPWQDYALIGRRVDQTLTSAGGNLVIQSDLHWSSAGTPIYETTGLYGVDRATRANIAGYGNRERHGQFLFPPHLQPTTYTFWNSFYLGPQVAAFSHVDTLDGLLVYVFDFAATNTDDTSGYAALPDIPERYYARSDGWGRLWIEPSSGIVVDLEDQGITYFVDPQTNTRVAELYAWADRYTPETRAAQLNTARAARTRIIAAETWAPAGLLMAGAIWLIAGVWRATRMIPAQRAQRASL